MSGHWGMASAPGAPGRFGGGDGRPDRDPLREGDVATRPKQRVARPPRFRVVLFNDDYTPMEFVVGLLEQMFGKSPAEATQIMLHVHRNGSGVAGVFVLEVAETKVSSVHRLAETRGYPLRSGVEPE